MLRHLLDQNGDAWPRRRPDYSRPQIQQALNAEGMPYANLPGTLRADGPRWCDNVKEYMDLWFELMDAGYTEDEAFDLIEMVMSEERNLFDPEAVNDTQRGYISYIRSEYE